jgi:hypothetical protein
MPRHDAGRRRLAQLPLLPDRISSAPYIERMSRLQRGENIVPRSSTHTARQSAVSSQGNGRRIASGASQAAATTNTHTASVANAATVE